MKRKNRIFWTITGITLFLIMGFAIFSLTQQSILVIENFLPYTNLNFINLQDIRVLIQGSPVTSIPSSASWTPSSDGLGFSGSKCWGGDFETIKDMKGKHTKLIAGFSGGISQNTVARMEIRPYAITGQIQNITPASQSCLGDDGRLGNFREQGQVTAEIISSDLDFNKFNFRLNGFDCGDYQATGEIGIRVGFGASGGVSNSCASVNVQGKIKSIGWRPLFTELEPTDVIVQEVFNPNQDFSISNLKYAFPDGGFKAFDLNLPPMLVFQGQAGFEFQSQIYNRAVNGEVIDLNQEFPSLITLTVFYIVDNLDGKITTACDPQLNILNPNGQCVSRNALFITGSGGVFDPNQQGFIFSENLPCANLPNYNLVVTDPINSTCQPDVSVLIGDSCLTCIQKPSMGGVCSTSVNPETGECIAQPEFNPDEEQCTPNFNENNQIISCTLKLSGRTIPIFRDLRNELESTQKEASSQIPSVSKAKSKKLLNTILVTAILGGVIILIAFIITRFKKK